MHSSFQELGDTKVNVTQCCPRGFYSQWGCKPREEGGLGEVDLVGRTVAHVDMCRPSSKYFSVVFIYLYSDPYDSY